MNSNKIDRCKDQVTMYILNSDKTFNDIEIDQIIDTMTPIFKSLFEVNSKEEIDEIRKRVKADCSIKMSEGAHLHTQYKRWFLDKKADLDMKYWNRYKKYLVNKGFSVNVVNEMDDILDILTDYLGDPNSSEKFQRRGLVIGDVQSGKTSNYTGLMCKAADAGYKVIILLTGTIEKLRRQTQGRIDEGFVGMKSLKQINNDNEDAYVGVGKIDSSVNPIVLTTTQSDFKTNTVMTIESTGNSLLFVIKKNVSTLKKLNKWLKDYNLNGKEKIDNSLLMIDDESDNASINTNKKEKDPTATNKQIRETLNLFTKASYVGFTATPFANIFIDPDLDKEMEQEDIFPKDYIYCLDAPSNYIGARDIFSDDAKYSYMLKTIEIEELEDTISTKLKKEDYVYEIPESMKKAIRHFMIGNVIRDLRGQTNQHRSMMINVNILTNVHIGIEALVKNYVKEVQNSVRVYGKLDDLIALEDKNIKNLFDLYHEEFMKKEFSWNEIKENLLKAIEPIRVEAVNRIRKNSLNYEDSPQRIIAVGGFSLSRGITLEGLMTSYMYGNTRMYDTLMQKGRWFGYRKGYEDLCTVWMTEQSREWYERITEATDELRKTIKKMQDEGAKPIDFGLMVRCDVDSLEITARNKMRTAKSIERNISLSQEVVETSIIKSDINTSISNHKTVEVLLKNNKDKIFYDKYTNKYGLIKIKKEDIVTFIESFEISEMNYQFNSKGISEFIKKYAGIELDLWDVVFISGSGKCEEEFKSEFGIEIKDIKRKFSLENEEKLIRISGSKSRLGSQTDTIFGLSEKDVEELEDYIYKTEVDRFGNPKTKLTEKDYFKVKGRRPLLMIYYIELTLDNNNNIENISKKKILNKYNNMPLIGIGVGIPKLVNEETKYAKYKINLIAQKNGIDQDVYGQEDEEEDE